MNCKECSKKFTTFVFSRRWFLLKKIWKFVNYFLQPQAHWNYDKIKNHGYESFCLTNSKIVEKVILKVRFDLDIWYNFSITSSKSSPFFSSISEESENDSDEGSGRRGSLAPPSGRFSSGGGSGGSGGGAAELAGVPGDGHEKENLLPNDQSDSIYLTN